MKEEYDPVVLLARAAALREAAKSAEPVERDTLLAQAVAAELRARASLETPAVSEQTDTNGGEPTRTRGGTRNFGSATTSKVLRSILA